MFVLKTILFNCLPGFSLLFLFFLGSFVVFICLWYPFLVGSLSLLLLFFVLLSYPASWPSLYVTAGVMTETQYIECMTLTYGHCQEPMK
jgi:hypothetical protein